MSSFGWWYHPGGARGLRERCESTAMGADRKYGARAPRPTVEADSPRSSPHTYRHTQRAGPTGWRYGQPATILKRLHTEEKDSFLSLFSLPTHWWGQHLRRNRGLKTKLKILTLVSIKYCRHYKDEHVIIPAIK